MILCREGKISVYWFGGTILYIWLLTVAKAFLDILPGSLTTVIWGPLVYLIALVLVLYISLKPKDSEIAVRASFLGWVLAVSVLVIIYGTKLWKPMGVYFTFMAFFHYSEYLAIAYTNQHELSTDSFILNHSIHYTVAAISSWAEFVIEVYFVPEIKQYVVPLSIGVMLCASGETIRKLAIVTANSNFNHVVQCRRQTGHQLVTHGVYRFMRHPSYMGWFWWSIGTQIILSNPVCTFLYALVSWKFFHDRIFIEEITLLDFFKDDYVEYQSKTGTGLPFIRGYRPDIDKKYSTSVPHKLNKKSDLNRY